MRNVGLATESGDGVQILDTLRQEVIISGVRHLKFIITVWQKWWVWEGWGSRVRLLSLTFCC